MVEKSLVEFRVRAQRHKMCDLWSYYFVDSTDVAGDVDTPAPQIRFMERVIVQ